MAKHKQKKVPIAPHHAIPDKVPRGASLAVNVPASHFKWGVGEIDWEGGWGWQHASVRNVLDEVIPRLHHFESMTWATIESNTGSHFVEIAGLSKSAQQRLEQLGKSETGRLFSLRVTGRTRIWGVRKVARLELLWWDPHHSVCPSALSHT